MFLRALTPIHAGAGAGVAEHVDLPIQRDEFGLPCIWGSSLKGALRGVLTRKFGRDAQSLQNIRLVFGPEPPRGYVHSGAAAFLDARLLLMPARSLKGVWVYITSRHMFGYLAAYLESIGRTEEAREINEKLRELQTPITSTDRILVTKDDQGNGKAVLNEFTVECTVNKNLIHTLFEEFKAFPSELVELVRERGVVFLDDDDAYCLVRRSLLVQYRVRLKRGIKVVEEGPWSEESMPQETILVAALAYRGAYGDAKAEEAWKWFLNKVEEVGVLWLGGKETIGRGLAKIYLVGMGDGEG